MNVHLQVLPLCLVPLHLLAQPAGTAPRLAGIVNLPGFKQALVQNLPANWSAFSLLKEGERDGNLEMVEIHPQQGTAKVVFSGKTEVLSFTRKPDSTAPVLTLALEQAELAAVLRWYGRLANRNVLQHPSARMPPLDMRAFPADEKSAALALEKALAEKGLAAVPDGEKFVLIVRKEQSGALLRLPSPKPHHDVLAPGMIQFFNTDARQVVQFYAELVGRSFEPNETFKAVSGTVAFQSQTPLSREEVRYALDRLFAWQGFRIEFVGEKSLRCVRVPGI